MISFYNQVTLLPDAGKAERNVPTWTSIKPLVLSPTALLERLELLKQFHLILVSYHKHYFTL